MPNLHLPSFLATPALLLALAPLIGACDPIPLEPDPEAEKPTIDVRGLVLSLGQLERVDVFADLVDFDGVAQADNDITVTAPDGVDVISSELDGSTLSVSLRATATGPHDIVFRSASWGLTETYTPTVSAAPIWVEGESVLLPSEHAEVTSGLLGRDGCPLPEGGTLIGLQTEGSSAAVTTGIADFAATEVCPAATDAVFSVQASYQFAGSTNLRFSNLGAPAEAPVEHLVNTFDGGLAILDQQTLSWTNVSNSPNNNCTIDLEGLREVFASIREGASNQIQLTFPRIGTVTATSPVPGIMVLGPDRTEVEPNRWRSFSGDVRYRLQRLSSSTSESGAMPSAAPSGPLQVVGEGGGNYAVWDAASGGTRLCANFYRFEFVAPIS